MHGMAESDHGSSRATMAAGDADHASLSLNERKSLLRKELLLARAALTDADRSAAGRALRDAVLDLPEVGMAGAIAAYLGVGTEPETSALVYALWKRGSYVLLPVLLPDNDLDWASYEGPDSLERGPHGLAQPTEPLRGVAGTIALLYDTEFLARVPAGPHDQRVRVVAQPSRGITRLV